MIYCSIRAVNEEQELLLEAHEQQLQPKPGKHQHDDHVREGKGEPASKVDYVRVIGVDPERGKVRKNNIFLVFSSVEY